jgi:hypothetical protein
MYADLQALERQRFAVRPTPEYRLSFSLLNADPSQRLVTWEFEDALTSKYFKKPMLRVCIACYM